MSTTEQNLLPFGEPKAEPLSIQERFDAFDDAHPDIRRMLLEMVAELRDRGVTRYSIKALLEVVRWRRTTSGKDADGWKINNVYSSRYARRLVEEMPELEGFFETRELKSE